MSPAIAGKLNTKMATAKNNRIKTLHVKEAFNFLGSVIM